MGWEQGLKNSLLPFVIFAIGKKAPKSIFISSETDSLGRKSHKPVAEMSDKSVQETCSYLPVRLATFAVETL